MFHYHWSDASISRAPLIVIFKAPLVDVRLELGVGIQDFLLMMRPGVVQDNMSYHDQELLALSGEAAR